MPQLLSVERRQAGGKFEILIDIPIRNFFLQSTPMTRTGAIRNTLSKWEHNWVLNFLDLHIPLQVGVWFAKLLKVSLEDNLPQEMAL